MQEGSTHDHAVPARARATQPGERWVRSRRSATTSAKGFQFSGRASRSEYWWIALYSFLFAGVLEFAQAQNENWLENTGVFGNARGSSWPW
ncbi:DUF805 domain-containing protein [Kocuria rhizophila]|nr:DUF805 domain-containing protein [Kocuria rhizophila]